MEILNLTVPKKTYLSDFLAEEETQSKIQESWIFMHDSIIKQLISNDGFKRKKGIHNLDILYRYTEEILEEFVIFYLPFQKWSIVFAIRDNKNEDGILEDLYNERTITTEEPRYLIRLKMEA